MWQFGGSVKCLNQDDLLIIPARHLLVFLLLRFVLTIGVTVDVWYSSFLGWTNVSVFVVGRGKENGNEGEEGELGGAGSGMGCA
jgi:hypothetical protein